MSRKSPKSLRRGIVPMALMILVSLAWFGFHMWQWHEISSGVDRMSSVADDATIVRVDTRTESTGNKKRHRETETHYRPVVEFEDSDHIRHTAPSLHESSNGSLHLTGDKVSVLYDPRDADSGCVIAGEEEATRRDAGVKLAIAVIGLVMAGGIGAVVVIVNRAYDREEASGQAELAGDGETNTTSEDASAN